MSDLADNENSFSDDSLEASSKKTVKTMKKNRGQRKRSYLQLHQQRKLIKEAFESKKCSIQSQHFPSRAESCSNFSGSSMFSTGNKHVCQTESIRMPDSIKPTRSGQELGSEKFHRESIMLKSISEEENQRKLELVKKRLEYGNRMNSLNKLNCREVNTKKVLKSQSAQLPEKTERANERSGGNGDQRRMSEIENKIHALNIRHQEDKRIAEKIKKTMYAHRA